MLALAVEEPPEWRPPTLTFADAIEFVRDLTLEETDPPGALATDKFRSSLRRCFEEVCIVPEKDGHYRKVSASRPQSPGTEWSRS